MGAAPCGYKGADLVLGLSYSFPQRIDDDQSELSFRVVRPTTPRPILRMVHQFSHDRIFVHIDELFPQLLFTPHIEVIEPPLPKGARFLRLTRERKPQLSGLGTASCPQGARYVLFQNLEHFGWVSIA